MISLVQNDEDGHHGGGGERHEGEHDAQPHLELARPPHEGPVVGIGMKDAGCVVFRPAGGCSRRLRKVAKYLYFSGPELGTFGIFAFFQ